MIGHLVTPEAKIIIELNRFQIELIAALAHLFLSENENNPTAKSLIAALVEQTNYVFSDPKKHGVGTKLLCATTTQEQWGYLGASLDMGQLDHIFYSE